VICKLFLLKLFFILKVFLQWLASSLWPKSKSTFLELSLRDLAWPLRLPPPPPAYLPDAPASLFSTPRQLPPKGHKRQTMGKEAAIH
jgi:hypothetical protein